MADKHGITVVNNERYERGFDSRQKSSGFTASLGSSSLFATLFF